MPATTSLAKTPVASSLRVFAAACLVLGTAGAQAFQLQGFRGMAWGDAAARLGESSLVAREGDVACYQRQHENMLFGDSALKSVRYCFHQDRLFMVTLSAAVNAKALARQVERTYGQPDTQRGPAAVWGAPAAGSWAELVAHGKRSQLSFYSGRYEPASSTHASATPDARPVRTAGF